MSRQLGNHVQFEEDTERQHQQDDEEEKLQERRIKVIHQLLKEFNLEECMKGYRSLYNVEHRVDPKDLSLESEMAGLKVKSHLETLMGTDIIKLNDREYMLSLQNQLVNEYESAMNKQEEQRSEKERRRQRRLYIEGLQDLPNIDLKPARSKTAGVAKSSTSRPGDRKSIEKRGGTISILDPQLKCRHSAKMDLKRVDSDEEDFINPPIGVSANPSRSSRQRPRAKTASQPKKKTKECEITLAVGKMSPEERRKVYDKYPVADEKIKTMRAQLMRQLRNESTVKGLYRTADLVMAAPVAELDGETATVAGSPQGSMSNRSGTQSNLTVE